MEHKMLTYILDGGSLSAFLLGAFTGQTILMILGGLASIMAILNHGQQWIDRRKQNKKK